MVLTCLLRKSVMSKTINAAVLEAQLQHKWSSSVGNVWLDASIWPTIIPHLFIRAKREGSCDIHMLYLHMMVPDFFAAGHIHYARYITWHIVELATSVPKQAMAVSHLGQHVDRHKPWDVIVSDQSGAQTYIWYEKARGCWGAEE